MKVYAKDKEYVVNSLEILADNENIAVISITNTGDPHVLSRSYRYLPLVFDDVRPSLVGNGIQGCSDFLVSLADCKAMSVKQALLIHYFIGKLPKEIDTIIVHCSAGISRSGGVAKFLSETLDCDQAVFESSNKQIQPNIWVHDLLWATYLDLKDEP